MASFQENLKRLRMSNNLTQSQLAEILNKSRASISLYEIGKRIPSIQTIKELCSIFHVTIDQLIGD